MGLGVLVQTTLIFVVGTEFFLSNARRARRLADYNPILQMKWLDRLVYSITTSDKYAEYDSSKSFNRVNRPRPFTDSLLYSNPSASTVNLSQEPATSLPELQGIHETKLAWRHIRNWLAAHLPDANTALDQHATPADLLGLQRDLGVTLPACVKESYLLVDGQANLQGSCDDDDGIFFGLRIMLLDEISVATEHWRKVARALSAEQAIVNRAHSVLRIPSSYDADIHPVRPPTTGQVGSPMAQIPLPYSPSSNLLRSRISHVRDRSASSPIDAIPPQLSVPPGYVLKQFAHPMWIPLITDEVGNYIGIDMSPDPCCGTPGQVIIFGREWDCKFVVAETFGDFLLIFANDLETGNCDIRPSRRLNSGDLFMGSEGALFYADKQNGRERPYMQVLRDRAIGHWLSECRNYNRPMSLSDCVLLKALNAKDNHMLKFKHTNADSYIAYNLSLIASVDDVTNEGNGGPNTFEEAA